MDQSIIPIRENRLLFIGATRNYFKVGHATIDYLAKNFPTIKIRLAIPQIDQARKMCEGKNIELIEWNPDDSESLDRVFENCQATLLVPPIANRIETTQKYLQAARKAGIEFLVCLGIQHENPVLKLAYDANMVKKMLIDSNIPHCHLHLPVFLENLLYQKRSIIEKNQFSYPCRSDSKFSYIACQDLAPVIADMLINRKIYSNTKWTSRNQIDCQRLAREFSDILGRPIKFKRMEDEEFLFTILNDTGCASSPRAAQGVLEFWKEIDADRDMPSDHVFAEILGYEPRSASDWIREHKCCFLGQSCKHPQPPKSNILN